MAEPEAPKHETTLDTGKHQVGEVYAASLDMLRFLDTQQKELSSIYDDQRVTLQSAIGQLLKGLSLEQRALSLMTIWYLGNLSDDPRISELMSAELGRLDIPEDPATRLVLASALSRMAESESAKTMLREQFAESEGSEEILSILLLGKAGRKDVFQRIYSVQASSDD